MNVIQRAQILDVESAVMKSVKIHIRSNHLQHLTLVDTPGYGTKKKLRKKKNFNLYDR